MVIKVTFLWQPSMHLMAVSRQREIFVSWGKIRTSRQEYCNMTADDMAEQAPTIRSISLEILVK